jgi:uncharacterized protein YuzE
MKITYDKIADAIYLSLRKGSVAASLKMNNRVIVDLDEHKNLLGIEILDASAWQDVQNLEANVKSGIPIEITSRTPVIAA